MSQPAISKHLKVLQRAGLISRSRDAQWRPCSLNPAALKEVANWVEAYRKCWEQKLDRLGNYLETIQKKDAK
jgi:DNA-binding transcriptional ArsR family regulator